MVGGDGIACLVNPATPSVVYASTQNENVLRTIEGAMPQPSFRVAKPLFPAGEIVPFRTLIASDPSTPAVIYTVSYRVWKSVDSWESWIRLPWSSCDGKH